MPPELSAHLRSFCNRGKAMAPQLEAAFLAQLEDGEDPEDLSPARFATLATRAGFLFDSGIAWSKEVVRARLLPPDFVKSLALKLGSGEIDAPRALAELSEREAEITCRVGGIFLTEVLRLANELPPKPTPSEG